MHQEVMNAISDYFYWFGSPLALVMVIATNILVNSGPIILNCLPVRFEPKRLSGSQKNSLIENLRGKHCLLSTQALIPNWVLDFLQQQNLMCRE